MKFIITNNPKKHAGKRRLFLIHRYLVSASSIEEAMACVAPLVPEINRDCCIQYYGTHNYSFYGTSGICILESKYIIDNFEGIVGQWDHDANKYHINWMLEHMLCWHNQ